MAGAEDSVYSVPPPKKDKMKRYISPPARIQGVSDIDPIEAQRRSANCGTFEEKVPKFIKAPCEMVFKNNHNAWIVLGRDRPDKLDSGKGGAGETKCGSIDLVVGRMSFDPDDQAHTHNNFKGDAARIYICQRTDIDRNFAMPRGTRGVAEEVSAIAMRADEIRINARGGIKLVTGIYGKLNSHGQREDFVQGIDLIAGGQDGEQFIPFADPFNPTVDRLQPLVKGWNMAECIQELVLNIESLHHILQHFMTYQVKLNTSIGLHTHQGTAGIIPVTTSPDPSLASKAFEANLKTVADGIKQIDLNLSNINNVVEGKYLDPNGAKYICSDFNNTN